MLALVAPIKAFGSPVGDIVQRRPYVTQQSLLDATQPKGRRYYWKSEYFPRFESELLAGANEHALRIPSPHSGIILFPIGGTLHAVANEHSAVGNRDAGAVINLTSAWERPDEDRANIELLPQEQERRASRRLNLVPRLGLTLALHGRDQPASLQA